MEFSPSSDTRAIFLPHGITGYDKHFVNARHVERAKA